MMSYRRELSYERVMRSPHVSEVAQELLSGYLSPSALESGLTRLIERAQLSLGPEFERRFRRHELGRSMLGAPLIGWTLGAPELPRLLCASQHHGPENYGASFSLYLSYLLLEDPLFTPLLERFSFSFFPQQNPDAMSARGNGEWMSAPSWERFVERYQYDPRRLDVEHGIPPEWLPSGQIGSLERSRRVESRALASWIAAEREAYGELIYYQSGHAWGILDAPLYLMYPNLSSADPQRRPWATLVQSLNESAPYRGLTSAPPMTDDYALPPWLSDRSEGFYALPTREVFLASNPNTEVMCSSMDIVTAHAPEALTLVIEPPIFSCELIKARGAFNESVLSELRHAAMTHQAVVDRCDQLWRERLSRELGGRALEEAYFHQDERARSLAQLRLETLERRGVGERWAQLVQGLKAQDRSTSELRSGHIKLASVDQDFSAANLASLTLRLCEDPALEALYQQSLSRLAQAELKAWEVEWGVYVYLCPLLATAFEASA